MGSIILNIFIRNLNKLLFIKCTRDTIWKGAVSLLVEEEENETLCCVMGETIRKTNNEILYLYVHKKQRQSYAQTQLNSNLPQECKTECG